MTDDMREVARKALAERGKAAQPELRLVERPPVTNEAALDEAFARHAAQLAQVVAGLRDLGLPPEDEFVRAIGSLGEFLAADAEWRLSAHREDQAQREQVTRLVELAREVPERAEASAQAALEAAGARTLANLAPGLRLLIQSSYVDVARTLRRAVIGQVGVMVAVALMVTGAGCYWWGSSGAAARVVEVQTRLGRVVQVGVPTAEAVLDILDANGTAVASEWESCKAQGWATPNRARACQMTVYSQRPVDVPQQRR